MLLENIENCVDGQSFREEMLIKYDSSDDYFISTKFTIKEVCVVGLHICISGVHETIANRRIKIESKR